jgi:two-component system, chemotaxis family, CheB/CheR fusion protein
MRKKSAGKGGSGALKGAPPSPKRDPQADTGSASFPVVGVGASAGGMEAFMELLRALPANTGMAFVLIQHLDPKHVSLLADTLARSTVLPVTEIQDRMVLQPDHVYVIPSNAEVGIIKGRLVLLPRPSQGRKLHLPIDFFFRSLASDRRNQAIGVVLSGTGADGSEGLRAIKAEGGVTFAQDPASAKFSGMPLAAVNTATVDFVLPVADLARELVRIGSHPFVRGREADLLVGPGEDRALEKVLLVLRSTIGVDFSEYKLTSVRRRLARRMALHRLTTSQEYLRLLQEDPAEAPKLFEDVLIHVTSLFRDPQIFETLKETVFPELLKQKRAGGTIRLWSAGCSTGEEAYSLVIALLEFLAKEKADVPVQLFGTDVSERAVERARSGLYPDGAVRDLSPERLARFFTKAEGGGYHVSKAVRERCAFVKHDVASDPPFSKIDLVSCRNLLIYFGQDLQKRVLARFQFALNQPGYLLLGNAENIPEGNNLFSTMDKQHRIFARSSVRSAVHLAPARDLLTIPPAASMPATRALPGADLARRTESMLLDRYAPPGVVVNERMEILHFRGRTGPFLEPAPGQPQHDLLKMARKGLMTELRIATSRARREHTTIRRPGVRIQQDDGITRRCDIVVTPLSALPGSQETLFAVLFEPPTPDQAAPGKLAPKGRRPSAIQLRADARRADGLEDELKTCKEYLQSIIEEHQRTNEELLAANEELGSGNEELQSLNEELETAKEELQSTNEELSTLNEELQSRNTEINSVNSDLVNILGTVEVAIVIVDNKRCIRRFTPKARPILNLRPSDVGRPIDDIKSTLDLVDLDQKIAEVIETVTIREEETQSGAGRWYRLQIRPYTTVDKRIEGAVLSIVDIDVLKRALGAAEGARDYARATVEAVQMPLVVLDEGLRILSVNASFVEKYQVAREDLEGKALYGIMNCAWDLPTLRSALERVLEGNGGFLKLELERELPRLGPRAVSLSGRIVSTPGGGRLVLLAVEDITERQRTEAERACLLADMAAARASAEEANRAKDLFLATLSHELRTPLTSLLLQVQSLLRGNSDEVKMRKGLHNIERAAIAQAHLIDDLLDISRIITGKMQVNLATVDLASIVRGAVDTLAPAAERKQIAFELHIDPAPPAVLGDTERLQQVVLNLLTNAVKFTPDKGRVTVTVDSAEGCGRVRVADTGEGIEEKFLPHLFDRFSQEVRGQTRTHAGLGLGLAISRSLVEAHGGSVVAESAGKDQGATFTVLLPVSKGGRQHRGASSVAPFEGEAPDGTIKATRVLIVEDDPGTREALADMLSVSGAEVRAAESARGARTLFDEFHPQLLVCDIAMPDEDGYSLLSEIRARGPGRGGDVPALALTALATDDDRRRAFAAGFQMHMTKPVDIDRLIAALVELRSRATDSPPPPPAPAGSRIRGH